MRYLWVEDFNDESNGNIESELKERLIDFFDLHNDKIIVKKTLSSAIKFLENKENFDEIDAVLIDIRFPEGNEGELYSRYFCDIVTPKFYSDNIEDASGIMLYLLLIFRYHLSQHKMAFISANISSDNKMKTIQDMVEIIVKSKYTSLSEEDKMSYRTSERKLGVEILNVHSEKKEWDTFISNDGRIESIDIDILLKQIRLLPLHHHDKFKKENTSSESFTTSAQVKYNDVKKQFDKIGFVMPSAFEKPKIGEKKDKRYSFMQWETELYTNPYNAIRSNVQEMCIILIDYLNTKKSNTEDRIYSSFLNLLTCDQEEKNYYDETFFIRYLKNLKGIFAIDCTESIEAYCERSLKEITSLWEASALPKYETRDNTSKRSGVMQNRCFKHRDNCYYAIHAVLKLIRNWVGHQGIKNVDIIDVGLVFLLSMRGIFDINNLPEQYIHEYRKYEDNILSMYELDTNVLAEVEKSLNYFYDLNNATKKGNNSSREIYDKISGLGHSQSSIRRDVSMDEMYMLLYHILNQGCDNIYDEIKKRIKARTWTNWRKRYNERFESYIKCV